jgi:hypothetical protein
MHEDHARQVRLHIDDWLRCPGDSGLFEYLASNNGTDTCRIHRLAHELGQPCTVFTMPNVIARIGQKSPQDTLLAQERTGYGCEIASRANCKVGVELVVQVVHWHGSSSVLKIGRRPRLRVPMQIIVISKS